MFRIDNYYSVKYLLAARLFSLAARLFSLAAPKCNKYFPENGTKIGSTNRKKIEKKHTYIQGKQRDFIFEVS